MVNLGKFKNHVIQTKTVTMSTSAQAQDEIQIPDYGDIAGFEVIISEQTTAGTLVNAKTIDNAVKGMIVKSKNGEQLMQSIRGSDFLFLERYRNKGRSRTIPTSSSSATSDSFWLPLNIEKADQEARVQLTVAPYSDMDDSGATGGSITYSIVVWYYDSTEQIFTEKVERITKSVNSGNNTFGIDLPKLVNIQNLLFKIGTESNITNIDFSADGQKEMDDVALAQLSGFDNALLISGHTSGEFSLYNAPFFSTTATRFDVKGSGSDTMEIFVVSTKPQQ